MLDTNLLVLVTIGLYRRDRIPSFKRTRQYTHEDFDLVYRLLACFSRRVTTPNILTEVHNLVWQLPDGEHPAVSRVLAKIVEDMFEIYIPTPLAVTDARYSILGLTDVTTLMASGKRRDIMVIAPSTTEGSNALGADQLLVITDDLALTARLSKIGRDVLNINHLRTFS